MRRFAARLTLFTLLAVFAWCAGCSGSGDAKAPAGDKASTPTTQDAGG